MRPTERRIITALKRSGRRLTPQRRVLIRAIASSADHLTPTEIYEKVRSHHPNIGLVTVYRTLDLLAEHGLLCQVHAGASCPSYTLGTPEDHHHLVCSGCGKVVDFTADSLPALEARLASRNGFTIDHLLLEMVGRCRLCRQRAAPSRA